MKIQYSPPRSIYFEQFPFYWQPLTQQTKGRFPEALPFELVIDEKSGVLSQTFKPEVLKVIHQSYGEGTYVEGLMNETGIGRQYADDFLAFVDKAVGLENIKGRSILEIGCGSGFLLSQLSKRGAHVLGYEPGYTALGKHDIPVIKGFFPSPEVKGKIFDVIIAFAVLEHIAEPESLLKHFKDCLAPQGRLILAVPDCEDPVREGNISMLIHEHFSYFTIDTFKNFMAHHGYVPLQLVKAGFGAILYGDFKLGAASSNQLSPCAISKNVFLKIAENFKKTEAFLNKHKQKTVGIYVPFRAMNMVYLLKDTLASLNIHLRFFDDSSYLRGKYCPGIDIPIENVDTLNSPRCDVILIYSYYFGKVIYEKIKHQVSPGTLIVNIGDL